MELKSVYILVLAFLLDCVLGDPTWLPHLITGFGKLISLGEKKLNRKKFRTLKGMFLSLILVVFSFVVPMFILQLLEYYGLNRIEIVVSTILLFYCIANKTLVKEGKAVFDTLENKGVEAGRKRLSRIVGRDTSQLSPQQIRIATLESMSENLSDGVIAPLFYFALLGIPGAVAYKMINTLDSMIAYKTERYEKFGKFAAKLDDIVNYIPSRLTAVLMLAVSFKWSGLKFVFREGKKHSSPNAGYPEAALAYILDCQFGGANTYFGKLIEKPLIGTNAREIQHSEIEKTTRINYATSIFFVLIIVLILTLPI